MIDACVQVVEFVIKLGVGGLFPFPMADNIANHAADPLVDWQEAFAAFHPSALDSLHETIRAELGYGK